LPDKDYLIVLWRIWRIHGLLLGGSGIEKELTLMGNFEF
jgi:hypothetical protein